MPWFKVDDGFHSHPKVLGTSAAAIGLWTLAGSWSSHHLTEGFIPDDTLDRILPGSRKLADELVRAGLWKRRKKGKTTGYQFHQFLQRNPTRKAVENERKQAAERQRRRREALSSRRDNSVTHGVSHRTPTRPVTTTDEASTTARPQPRLPNHNFDEFKINGVVATRQPPPFAEAVQHALNPERKT